MGNKPWWYPKLIDKAYLDRVREDYPDDADLDDESLRETYNLQGKYALLWDHVGDAQEAYEPLADAYLQAEKDIAVANKRIERLEEPFDVWAVCTAEQFYPLEMDSIFGNLEIAEARAKFLTAQPSEKILKRKWRVVRERIENGGQRVKVSNPCS